MCCGYSRAQTAVIHSLHEHPLRTDCVPGHEDTNMKMTQCKPSRSAQPAWRCGRGGDELPTVHRTNRLMEGFPCASHCTGCQTGPKRERGALDRGDSSCTVLWRRRALWSPGRRGRGEEKETGLQPHRRKRCWSMYGVCLLPRSHKLAQPFGI